MKKKYRLGIFAIFAIALLSMGFVSAIGFGQGKMPGLSNEDRDELNAFRQDLEFAIENNDYDSWKELMESQITESNFNSMVESYQEREEYREAMEEARESGDFEKMEELKEQFGFSNFRGERMKGNGMALEGNCLLAE